MSALALRGRVVAVQQGVEAEDEWIDNGKYYVTVAVDQNPGPVFRCPAELHIQPNAQAGAQK